MSYAAEPIDPDRVTITGIDRAAHRIVIRWADGHTSHFPFIWLRHNCVCSVCGSTETARRHLRMTEIPRDIAPSNVRVDETGCLTVTWGADGHQSSFDAAWLRGHCLTPSERERRRFKPVTWHPTADNLLKYYSFPALAEGALRLQFLERLRDYGFAILSDVSCDPNATERVARSVGTLRSTNYGIYELISRPTPQLVGDTSVALDPHTDEPYRHSPPGLTFFHVLAQSADGGDSTLVDGCFVAEVLRSGHPEAFAVLSTVPAAFHRTLQEGRAFHAIGPIIATDRDGHFEGFRLLDRGMAPLDVPEDQVVPFYDALRLLLNLLYDTRNQLTVKIAAGEMLVFNNQRLLHGRTAFDPTTSHRHIRSCNVDLDEFYSSLRLAYREGNREEAHMYLPQGPG
jgi:gamma-butyrobetaine dioxygenase